MANPSEILNDPDYVNANAATKQAIFDKHVANDPSFSGANPVTQQAIRTRFGVVPTTVLKGAAAIPVEPGANLTPTLDQPSGWLNKVRGAVETVPALATGLIAGPVGQVAGLAQGLFGGNYGTPQGVQQASRTAADVSGAMTYQPRTAEGQQYTQAIGEGLNNLISVPIPMLNDLARSAAPAMRAAGDLNRAVVKAPLPFGMTVEQQAARTIAGSFKDAGRIDAAKAGSELGLVADPAAMNPTRSTKFKSRLTDPKAISAAATKSNDAQLPVIISREMGLPENTSFTTEAPFTQAKELASGPYKEAAQIPIVTADATTVGQIKNLAPRAIAGRGAEAAKGASEIQLIIDDLSDGVSGQTALNTISALRKDANSIWKSEKLGAPLTSAQRDMAAAYKGIADAIEDLIAKSQPQDPRFADRFNAARTQMAKIATYQDAVNYGSGKFDPSVIAKQTAENPNLTGDIATIGRFTNNFPESMGAVTPEGVVGAGVRHISRASLSGTIGAGLGALTPLGPIGGGILGVGVGEAASALNARRMVSPAYQAMNAIPIDYRPPVNNLRPVTPGATPNGLVPYDYANATAPNWVPGGRPQGPVITPYVDPNYPQLGAPSAQSTLQGVASRRAFDYQMEKALAEQQAAQATTQAAGARQTTGAGTPLIFDAVTGKLVPAGETLRGATPNIQVIESTGKSLASASQKVSSGQQALMSAEERIAWNKTRVDLASVAPEIGSLSAKEIAAKMMDRQWVNDAITKAREKAAAFDELSKKATDAQAIRNAAMKREKMLDLMNDLEDSLRPSRSTSSGQQGPKTRAFNRNMLSPESQNAMVP